MPDTSKNAAISVKGTADGSIMITIQGVA